MAKGDKKIPKGKIFYKISSLLRGVDKKEGPRKKIKKS